MGKTINSGGTKTIDQVIQEVFDSIVTGNIAVGFVNDGALFTVIIPKSSSKYCPIICITYKSEGACIVKTGSVYDGIFKGFTVVH